VAAKAIEGPNRAAPFLAQVSRFQKLTDNSSVEHIRAAVVDRTEAAALPMANGVLVDTKPIRQLARRVAVVNLGSVRIDATSAHGVRPQPILGGGSTPS